jgi:hypothetical protein
MCYMDKLLLCLCSKKASIGNVVLKQCSCVLAYVLHHAPVLKMLNLYLHSDLASELLSNILNLIAFLLRCIKDVSKVMLLRLNPNLLPVMLSPLLFTFLKVAQFKILDVI